MKKISKLFTEFITQERHSCNDRMEEYKLPETTQFYCRTQMGSFRSGPDLKTTPSIGRTAQMDQNSHG